MGGFWGYGDEGKAPNRRAPRQLRDALSTRDDEINTGEIEDSQNSPDPEVQISPRHLGVHHP